MLSLPLQAQLQQAQELLSRVMRECTGFPPDRQDQIAREVDRFTSQLSTLLSADRSQLPLEPIAPLQVAPAADTDPFFGQGDKVGRVLQGAQAGIFVWDLVHNTSSWTPELRELLGVSPEEPSSLEKFLAMVHSEDLPQVERFTQAAIEKGGTFYQEFRIIRPDGKVLWLNSVGFIEQDEQGRPTCITGINQDITQRKHAEQALRENEAALRESELQARLRLDEIENIYQNAPVGLCVFDTQLRFLRVNQRLAEINGIPVEGHIGKTPREVVPDLGEQAETALRSILETGQPLLDIEIHGTTAAQPGVMRYWNERWTPLRNNQGTIIAISVVAEEITERKQHEEEREQLLAELDAERRQLTEILEHMPVGVIIAEAPSGKVIFQNRRVEDILLRKHASESVEDYGPWQPHYPDGRPYPLDQVPMARTVRHGEVVLGEEMKFEDARGRWVNVHVNASPIYGADGKVAFGVLTMEDITEQRKMEEALRDSEAKFRGAFANASIGFAMTAPDGRFMDANPAYCKLTGYGIEELRSFAFNQLIHPDDYAANIRMNEKMVNGEISDYVIENRYIHKDGHVVQVRKSISVIRDRYGAPQWFIALVEDISDRHRVGLALQKANAELINERNRLLAVMEALPIGLAIYDEKGGVLQANQGFEEVWGSPRPPANSVDDYELYKAWWVESGQRVQPEEWAAAQAVQNGKTVTGQYIRIQKFDGTQGFILNSGAPVCDAQGKITGGVVAILDITDRVWAENALRENQERFRVALSNVPLLVYTCDRHQRYTWVYNPLRGFRAEDVLGKRDDELLGAENAAEMIAAKQQALDSGQGSVQEIKLPAEDGYNYYILTTEPIKDSRGRVTGLTCSAIDITEQRKLEIEQKESEMQMEVQRRLMEYREKERQEIARDLHDGPIQLVAGTIFHLQVAREALQDPVLKLELEQATMNLKAAVRELRDTMNELLPPAIIRFGFAKTARMHAEDFRERHPEIQLNLHLFDDGDRIPESARLALFRIYQESLNNIVKHAKASKIWVRLTQKDSQVQLQIRDNGQGFQVPADLVGQTQRGHYGLAGMKERAEAAGGKLTLSSEPGKGTKIVVTVSID